MTMTGFGNAVYAEALHYCSERDKVSASELQCRLGMTYGASEICIKRMLAENVLQPMRSGDYKVRRMRSGKCAAWDAASRMASLMDEIGRDAREELSLIYGINELAPATMSMRMSDGRVGASASLLEEYGIVGAKNGKAVSYLTRDEENEVLKILTRAGLARITERAQTNLFRDETETPSAAGAKPDGAYAARDDDRDPDALSEGNGATDEIEAAFREYVLKFREEMRDKKGADGEPNVFTGGELDPIDTEGLTAEERADKLLNALLKAAEEGNPQNEEQDEDPEGDDDEDE